MRCASHVVRDVHLMRFEMCISYMHTGLLARKMKQSSLRQQCFLESCECFLQLRVYCLCADVQLLRHLCIALFLFAQADEYFTATLRQAVERLDISGKQFFADKSVFGRIGLAGKFGVSLAILIIWPKFKSLDKIPPSLIAVIVSVLMVKFIGPLKDVNTIGSLYTIKKGLPGVSVPY